MFNNVASRTHADLLTSVANISGRCTLPALSCGNHMTWVQRWRSHFLKSTFPAEAQATNRRILLPEGACHTVPAQTWVSRPPPKDMNFPNFLAIVLVVTLHQQLHLCAPLYLALSRFVPSFTPTYKAFYYHMSPFHPVMGFFYPRYPPPTGREFGVVCAGCVAIQMQP